MCSFNATKICWPSPPGASPSWRVIWVSESRRVRRPRIALEYSHESNKARTAALRHRLQEAGVDLDSAANAADLRPEDAACTGTISARENRNRGTRLPTRRQRMVLERLCGRWLKARGYAPRPTETRKGVVSVRERLECRGRPDRGGSPTFLIRSASQRFPHRRPGSQANARTSRWTQGRRHRVGRRNAAGPRDPDGPANRIFRFRRRPSRTEQVAVHSENR